MEQRKEPAPEQEDDSSSEEYEEETTYVVLDLGSDFTKEMIEAAATVHDGVSLINGNQRKTKKMYLQGLDTPTPFLRVGNLIYKGTLDQTVGTDLIFSASAQDESRPKRMYILSTPSIATIAASQYRPIQ
ncbi:hypothetical protein HK104_011393 [Borealophlyctis nickersoniae]|nr:hypothetical protein HK104_011393 [Borealophlyctis nickersoniae]